MTDRTTDAHDSFLKSVEQAMVDELQMPLANLDMNIRRVRWADTIESLATNARLMMPEPDIEDAEVSDRRQAMLRNHLVLIAANAWWAARQLGVEDDLPF